MLLVSLDCPLLIAPSVFSIVYIYDTRTQMFGIIQYIPTIWYVFGFHLATLIELLLFVFFHRRKLKYFEAFLIVMASKQ